MAGKKAVKLSKLPFSELRDKAKELEGFKSLNRFELLQAALKIESQPLPAGRNPREVKPEIKALAARLTEADGRQARRKLRRAKARLKRETRRYL